MIIKEEFEKYEEIRKNGSTNMFNISKIVELSNNILTREKCLEIMKDYEKLELKFRGKSLTRKDYEELELKFGGKSKW